MAHKQNHHVRGHGQGVAPDGPVALRAEFRDLPIASNSIDLLLLQHALEFSEHPHQILREVQRVLMPEGDLDALIGVGGAQRTRR